MVVAARNPLAQIGFEDDYAYSTGSYGSSTSHLDITRYALGAKGIDRIEKTLDSTSSSPTTVIQYPLYDAHGNMVATLSKGSSAGTYTVANQQAYEPWGSVVDSSGLSNTPKQAYCASLGHVADSELGLTYMRARYYEPSTGRFISEDPSRQGENWLVYGENSPANNVDADGRNAESEAWAVIGDILKVVGLALMLHCGVDQLALSRWTSALGAAFRTAKLVGNMYAAGLLKRAIFFLHAFSKSKAWESRRVVGNFLEGVLGYTMLVEGYICDLNAEWEDPYSANEGLSAGF